MVPRAPLLVTVALIAALALVACRSSSSGKATPTPAASPSAVATAATPVASTTPTAEIRAVDIAALPAVKQVLTDTGGQFDQASVIYADLTGAGQEDAVVPISSGGTLGDIAFLVVAPASGGRATTLLKVVPSDARGLAVDVVDGKLVMTEPVPGPNDPECCPSQLRETAYAWNGTAFTVESVVTVTNPNGGAKGTPSVPQPTP